MAPWARSPTRAAGAIAVIGDIRTEAGTDELVRDVRAAVDRVDIVVNNYGIAEGSDWDSSDTASWHGSYDTNVVTAVRVTQAFVPDMRGRMGSHRVRVDGRRHPARATGSPSTTRPRARSPRWPSDSPSTSPARASPSTA